MTSADLVGSGDHRRAQLAAAQAELVRCLVSGYPGPSGFDVSRLEAAATALLDKRSRAAARALPHTALHYGDRYTTRFTSWARTHPLKNGGPAVDGIRFLRSRPGSDRWCLPADVVVEWVALEVGSRDRHVSIRRSSSGVVVGLRLPGDRTITRAVERGRSPRERRRRTARAPDP